MAAKKVRGLTADELLRNSNRFIIKNICDEQVRLIDGNIQTAHKSGFSETEQELPVNFNIGSMDRYDAQIIIYSELVQIYIDKGYEEDNIGLEIRNGKAVFHVRWLNGIEADERDKRRRIIEHHMWKPKRN